VGERSQVIDAQELALAAQSGHSVDSVDAAEEGVKKDLDAGPTADLIQGPLGAL
jgi:hypothetical protein